MAQKFENEGAELAQSPRPIAPERQESMHPGMRPDVVNVPVTPGIHLSTYDSEHGSGASQSYFSKDVSKLRESMAQSPSEAAAGAASGHDILRRMSLTGNRQRKDSLSNIDPRVANPSLSLSGSVISATFCIPHSLQYRKGSDWVSSSITLPDSS
jgi:trehalose 6-phosphate synthase/phosphatase